ncbi:MAG: PIN domain-containing protein [Candidatus Velthaea sp.]
MSDKLFFDTNVLIYAVGSDELRKPLAVSWLSRGGNISVQVLNEFANTALRKLNRPWEDVVAALEALRIICHTCVSMTEKTHHAAVGLSRRHGFHLYDALIVASALEANCTTLVTEDMQHGQLIDGRLTIHNPFR